MKAIGGVFIILAICFPLFQASAEPYCRARYNLPHVKPADIAYQGKDIEAGSLDLLMSNRSRIWANAWRLMNNMSDLEHEPDTTTEHYILHNKAFNAWKEKVAERLQIQLDPKKIWYGQCNYEFALQTLAEREKQLGGDHPYIKEWMEAQEKVFSLCYGYSKARSFPDEPAKDFEPHTQADILKLHDRRYQLGAAYFYAMRYDTALEWFELLAADKASPYYALSHFMIARVYYHQFRKDGQKAFEKLQAILADPGMAPVHDMARELLVAVADHSDIPELRGIVMESYVKALTRENRDAFLDANQGIWYRWALGQNTHDYFYASYADILSELRQTNDISDWMLTIWKPKSFRRMDWQAQEAEEIFDKDSEEPLEHALAKWKKGKKPHWQVAVMLRLLPHHPATPGMLASFEAVEAKHHAQKLSKAEQYAYPTLLYNALRLYMGRADFAKVDALMKDVLADKKEYTPRIAYQAAKYYLSLGETEKAQKILDSVLSDRDKLNAQSLKALSLLRLMLARNLQEFMSFIPYETGLSRDGQGKTYEHAELPAEAIAVLDLLPATKLVEAASDDAVPAKVRTELAVASWARAHLLKNYALARQAAELIVATTPPLASYMRAYLQADTAEEYEHEGLYIMLKNPRISIFVKMPVWGDISARNKQGQSRFEEIHRLHTRNNWWCVYKAKEGRDEMATLFYKRTVLRGARVFDVNYRNQYRAGASRYAPKFQEVQTRLLANHAVLQLIDEKELAALEALETGTTLLAKRAVAWFDSLNRVQKTLPFLADSRIPETLHLAVRATRYGCPSDKGKGAYSRKAFHLLHRNYRWSTWTKKTPYWFSCQIYDCLAWDGYLATPPSSSR